MNLLLSQVRPFLRFALRADTLLHEKVVLPYEHRLVCIHEGEAEFTVNGETIPVTQNAVFVISAGVPYQLKSIGSTKTTWVYFDLTMEHSDLRERIQPMKKGSSGFPMIELFCPYKLLYNGTTFSYLYLPNGAGILKQVDKLLEYYDNDSSGSYQDDMLSGLLLTILAQFFIQLECSEKQTAAVVVVNRTTEYIHRHFAEPLSQEVIAAAVRFHKTYINRCMQEELGTTMHQYLMRYRLERAMQMLLYTHDSIAEIAVQTGFISSKNFATAFRKHYGLPPSAMRKKQEDTHG